MGGAEKSGADVGEVTAIGGTVFVSLTRLRVRSIRFMPLFAVDAIRTRAQVRRAEGFVTGKLLPDREWTFWTMTAWDSQASMRHYITTGAHKRSMPKLMEWCDEASIAHWEQASAALPSWEEADRRMREMGRLSKVRYPSATHAGMRYRAPRTVASAPITRA